ncbi:MAG: crotonase/enoyl-CoA hydratase family protein [Bradyrhizobium sp.]
MTERILTERRGHILVITINRPEARNAFDIASARAMHQAMDLLDAEDDLFVGIITGAGGTFSAGADLKAVARNERAVTERGGFGMFKRPSRKPLIAAVEGFAVGGGLELCLSCDLIVAARDAQMGLPEVRHNVAAVGGGLFRLPRRIPYHIAMELALTGGFYSAEFFHRHGLVNRISEPGLALDEALALAGQLLVNGPTALAASKEIVFQSANWSDEEAWSAQAPIAAIAFGAEDRAEGLRAFAEKRKPVWRGR